MKSKSHAAVVRSLKAYRKKNGRASTAEAIVRKLKEIKKTSGNTEREENLALFRDPA